jgi:hypothetical protein
MQLDDMSLRPTGPSHIETSEEGDAMKRVKLIATALVLAVLAALAGKATAQQFDTNDRTFLTFSTSVEMPGVTLQPGTYVFKLAESGQRNVVQVWDKDEKNMMGHWTFVQAERPRVTEDTVVMFKETREGATPAVQFWYAPGEKVGKEFIYPKDQAERIAARTGVNVRTEEGVVEASGAVAAAPAPAEPAVSEPAVDAALRDAPAAAQPTAAAGSLAGNRQPVVEREPEPAPAPAVAEAPAPAPAPEPAAPAVEETRIAADANASPASAEPRAIGTSGQQANELPATASPLALTGLLGLLSLAGAASIRVFRI